MVITEEILKLQFSLKPEEIEKLQTVESMVGQKKGLKLYFGIQGAGSTKIYKMASKSNEEVLMIQKAILDFIVKDDIVLDLL